MNEGRSFKFVCHNFSSEEFRESVRTECIRLRRLVWEKFRILSLSLRMRTRGLPYMTSAKFSYFLNPPCLCQKWADFVPFVCFSGTPSPTHCGRHIWKPPSPVSITISATVVVNVSQSVIHSLRSWSKGLPREIVVQWQSDRLTLLGYGTKCHNCMQAAPQYIWEALW